MKPIETRYAGHSFRSRLEARWAVFFDKLGVRWRYESQGYIVGVGPDEEPYLPDFRLPDFGAWVEVKGEPSERDLRILVKAAHRPEHGGLPDNAHRHVSLIVLRDIPYPQPGEIALHSALTIIDQDVLHTAVGFATSVEQTARLFTLVGPGRPELWMLQDPMTLTWAGRGWSKVREAYDAARQARFEYGASG